jgi:hypothetical protein
LIQIKDLSHNELENAQSDLQIINHTEL